MTEEDLQEWLKVLLVLREEAGMPSTWDIAARTGSSPVEVANTFNGMRVPQWPMASRVLTALGAVPGEYYELWREAASYVWGRRVEQFDGAGGGELAEILRLLGRVVELLEER